MEIFNTLFLYSGSELKSEVDADFETFADFEDTIEEFYPQYSILSDDKVYLVTPDLYILDIMDVENPVTTLDGVEYKLTKENNGNFLFRELRESN